MSAAADRHVAVRGQGQCARSRAGRAAEVQRASRPQFRALVAEQAARQRHVAAGLQACSARRLQFARNLRRLLRAQRQVAVGAELGAEHRVAARRESGRSRGHHFAGGAEVTPGLGRDALALRLAGRAQQQIAAGVHGQAAAVGQRAAVHAQLACCVDCDAAITQGSAREAGVLARAKRHILGRLQLRGLSRAQALACPQRQGVAGQQLAVHRCAGHRYESQRALAGQFTGDRQRAAALTTQCAARQRLAGASHRQIAARAQIDCAGCRGSYAVQAQGAGGLDVVALVAAQCTRQRRILPCLESRLAFRIQLRGLGDGQIAPAIQLQVACGHGLAAEAGIAACDQCDIAARSHGPLCQQIAAGARGYALALRAAGVAQAQIIASVHRQLTAVGQCRTIHAQIARGVQRQTLVGFRLACQDQILARAQLHGVFRLQARIRACHQPAQRFQQQRTAGQQLAIDRRVAGGLSRQAGQRGHRARHVQRALRDHGQGTAGLGAAAHRHVAVRGQGQCALRCTRRAADAQRAPSTQFRALVAEHAARQRHVAAGLQAGHAGRFQLARDLRRVLRTQCYAAVGAEPGTDDRVPARGERHGARRHHLAASAQVAPSQSADAFALGLADIAQPQIATGTHRQAAAVGQRAAVHAQLPCCVDRDAAIAQGSARKAGVLARAQRHVLGRLQLRRLACAQVRARAQRQGVAGQQLAVHRSAAHRYESQRALAGQFAVHAQRAAACAAERAARVCLALRAHGQIAAREQIDGARDRGGFSVQPQLASGVDAYALIGAHSASQRGVLPSLDLRRAFRLQLRALRNGQVASSRQRHIVGGDRLAAELRIAPRGQRDIAARGHRAVRLQVTARARRHALALRAAGIGQTQILARIHRQDAAISQRRAVHAQVAARAQCQASIGFRHAGQKHALASAQLHGAVRLQTRVRARRHLAYRFQQQRTAGQQLAVDRGIARGLGRQSGQRGDRTRHVQRALRAQPDRAACLRAAADRQVAAGSQRQFTRCRAHHAADGERARRAHVHALIAAQATCKRNACSGLQPRAAQRFHLSGDGRGALRAQVQIAARQHPGVHRGFASGLQFSCRLRHQFAIGSQIARRIDSHTLALRLAGRAHAQIAAALQVQRTSISQRAAVQAQVARGFDQHRAIGQGRAGQRDA
ncbi:hypothetical protein ACAE110713_29735 [Achromobacter aegrifaciens]